MATVASPGSSPTLRPTIAARLDRLPPARHLLALVARISTGGFFEFYDLFMTGYVAVGFIKAGIFVPTTPNFFDLHGFASFVGSGFAGMFLGTLLFSWVSDRFGRRATFTYSLLWYSIATAVMAFMSTPETIDLWRLIAGIGVGVQLITIDTYVTELTPKEVRGRYIAFSQVVTFSAVPVVAIASLLLIPHTFLGLEGWRYVVLVGALGAIVIWPLRAKLPESPRWLASHGRTDEADVVLSEMERRIAAEKGPLPAPEIVPDELVAVEKGDLREIWRAPYAGRTVMLTVFNFFQTIGFYGFASWIPTLLLSEGIGVTKSLAFVFAIALVNPLGPLVAMRFADVFERKWQIVGLALAIATCGLLWAQQREAAGIIAFGIVITLANTWFSSAFHAYQAELYPTRIRGQAVGFVYSWSRFSSIFVGFLIAASLKAYGPTGVFTIIAIAMIVVALTIGIFGPKSNRVRLANLSR